MRASATRVSWKNGTPSRCTPTPGWSSGRIGCSPYSARSKPSSSAMRPTTIASTSSAGCGGVGGRLIPTCMAASSYGALYSLPGVETAILGLGLVVAAAAAVRSTSSPCGQSMLSQITPMGEASRGYRYRTTAGGYVIVAVAGGASLGIALGLLAVVVRALNASPATLLIAAAIAALVGAVVDSGVLGFGPPFFLRQVNELWLGKYRAWLYGTGFGWQIGAGVVTYIMTAAVFVTIALGALTAGPVAALVVGVTFGLVRGLAVYLTRRVRSTADLYELHRRFDASGEPVRRVVIGVQVAVGVVALTLGAGVLAAAVAAAVTGTGVTLAARRRTATV